MLVPGRVCLLATTPAFPPGWEAQFEASASLWTTTDTRRGSAWDAGNEPPDGPRVRMD